METSVKRLKSDAVQGSLPTPFTRLWREKVSAGNLARPRSAEDYARLLDEWGYIVIPIFSSAEQKNAENAAFKQTLETMPEYREPRPELFQGEIHYVKGGFGALGNPSSFHNPFVREKRRWAMRTMVPIFKALQTLRENTPRKIEQIVDRMRVLRPKATISAETWHRDTTPAKFTHPGDLIYGGWINFDKAESLPQLLSAFPKSHRQLPLPSMAAKQGFAKANKDEIVELNQLKESILAKTGEKGWFIEVPPGHMLVFRQEMVHEVVRSKGNREEPSYRLFTAWRVTNSNEKFLSNQFSLDRLDVPLLKSSQPLLGIIWRCGHRELSSLHFWKIAKFKQVHTQARVGVSFHGSCIP
jgi:hypothetical protein